MNSASTNSHLITVEFFGMARHRVGRSEVHVEARTLRQLVAVLEDLYPQLAPLVTNSRLTPHYLLSRNGERFLSDMDTALHEGERILLLSADVGG